MDLAQFALTDRSRRRVDTASPLALSREVLGHDVDALTPAFETIALIALDTRTGIDGREIGILGVALLASAPARIAKYVQHRDEREVYTRLLQFACGDCAGFLVELGIPSGTGREVHRQQIAIQLDRTVRSLLAEQYRDLEARRFCDDGLHLVIEPDHLLAIEARLQVLLGPRIGSVESIEDTQAAPMLRGLLYFIREDGSPRLVSFKRAKSVQRLIQLADLLPQSQAGQEVLGSGPRVLRHIQINVHIDSPSLIVSVASNLDRKKADIRTIAV